jgi:hypothetical protein
MPKYLFHGSYTQEGFIGLYEEGGSGRVEAAKTVRVAAAGPLRTRSWPSRWTGGAHWGPSSGPSR